MSSYYRKIFPRIWNDERFTTLTGEQQRIALYILTAQSNRIGLFSFSPGKASEELHLSPRAFNKEFLQVCKTLNWQWDPAARVLYLPTWWRYNQPESVNNMKGNLKDLADLPTTTLLAQFAENTNDLSEDIKPTFIEALAQALAKGYPNPSPHPSPTQKQEQKQEQEQEQDSLSLSFLQKENTKKESDRVVSLKNGKCESQNKEFEEVYAAYPLKSGGKEAALRAWKKIKHRPSLEIILAAIEKQKKSKRWSEGFIPNMATWLNQGRWTDQLPEKPPYRLPL